LSLDGISCPFLSLMPSEVCTYQGLGCTVSQEIGGIWRFREDCESDLYEFEGSNPSPTTILRMIWLTALSFHFRNSGESCSERSERNSLPRRRVRPAGTAARSPEGGRTPIQRPLWPDHREATASCSDVPVSESWLKTGRGANGWTPEVLSQFEPSVDHGPRQNRDMRGAA
jgi:hypothetical protein